VNLAADVLSCVEYYRSAKFKRLRDSTKAEYRRYIEPLRQKHGHKPVKLMTTRFAEIGARRTPRSSVKPKLLSLARRSSTTASSTPLPVI
jgi:hypothetical protein